MSALESRLVSRIDEEAFRAVMRRVPTPVTIVTATDGEVYRGVTIGSFTSVSLAPPLVSFNLMRTSRMAGVLAGAEHFMVHVMGDEQADLCDHFARSDMSGEAQFAAVPHAFDTHGVPVLEVAVAYLSCRVHAIHDAGDHVLVLGEVVGLATGTDMAPVLYLNRAYRSVGSVAKASQEVPVKRSSSGTP